MGTVTRNILIVVKETGTTQLGTAMKGAAAQTETLAKGQNALSGALGQTRSGAIGLQTGVTKLDTSQQKAVKTTGNFTKSANTAGKATSGFAAKFQGNKGLIFAFTGIATSGGEAIGMLSMWQSANDKVGQAQERVNALMNAGITSGKELADAESDLADAKRGLQFATRIMALSFGDLIPFILLSMNSIIKLKDTITGAKGAVDAGAQAMSGLGTAAGAAGKGGLTQIGTSAGAAGLDLSALSRSAQSGSLELENMNAKSVQLGTGMGNMGRTVQDNTRLIGTRSNGLVGGISALSLGMDSSTKSSSKFKDAFTQIGTSIKNLPNTFKSVGSSIAGFFTNFGTHLGKLPGLFKTAGTAVMGFGKALMGLALNPIGLAIIGVSSAVLALATDFGGVRTALNNVGVAIGNAIPQAKGLLQQFGDMANGALDWVAAQLGVKKATDAGAESMKNAVPPIEKVKQSLASTLQLSAGFDNLRKGLDNLKQETNAWSAQGVIGANAWYDAVSNSLTATQKEIPAVQTSLANLNKIVIESQQPNADLADIKRRLGEELTKLQMAVTKEAIEHTKSIGPIEKTQNATLQLTNSQKQMTAQLNLLNYELQDDTRVTGEFGKKQDEARKSVEGWINDMGMAKTATEAQKESLLQIAPALGEIGKYIDLTGGKVVNLSDVLNNMIAEQKAVETEAKRVWGLMAQEINQVGAAAIPKIENALLILKKLHPELGAVVEEMYKNYDEATVETANGIFVVNEAEEKHEEKIKSKSEEVKKAAEQLKIYDKIQGLSLQNQQNAVKITEEQNKVENQALFTLQKLATARGLDISQIQKSSGELLTYIAANNKFVPTLDEINAKTAELMDARAQDEKAAIAESLAQDRVLASMNKSAPVIGMTAKGLGTLVQVYDDTANATGIAADEIGLWAAGLQKSQAVEKATLSTLQDYAKAHSITIPAGIAKDIEKTKEYIEIVQGIGPAAKKAADEAAKAFGDLANEGASALENLINEDLIKGDIDEVIESLEDVGSSIDTLSAKQAVIKPFLDDTDFTNDITGLKEIMTQTWAEADAAAKNGGDAIVRSLGEGMMSHLGELGPPVVNHINAVWAQVKATNPGKTGAELINILAAELGNPGPLTQAATKAAGGIPSGFQQGAAALPGVVSSTMQSGISEIFGKSGEFQNAGYTVANQTSQGFSSGSATFATEGQKAMYELLKSYDPAKAEAYAKANAIADNTQQGLSTMQTTLPTEGEIAMHKLMQTYDPVGAEAYAKAHGIGTQTGQGLASSSGEIASGTQTGIVQPITQQIGLVPGQAQTALAPLEGTTQGEFVKAQMAANGIISLLLKDMNTSFGYLKTNVQTHLQATGGVITTFVTTANTNLGGLNATTKAAQGAFSTMSTSVKTYMTSMSSNISSFATSAGSSMGKAASSAKTAQSQLSNMSTSVSTYMSSMSSKVSSFASSASSAFSKVGSAADSAKKKVDALKKSIDALKSKTITITVNARGSGLNYLRSGGSFVSFNPTGFAQTGKTFINSKPRKIGGVNISEFGKPELVSVIPLSNPGDPTDRNISMDMAVPKMQSIPQMTSGLRTGGGSGGGGGQPITVTGNLYVNVTMPDGRVLANESKKFLLDGFSGIT